MARSDDTQDSAAPGSIAPEDWRNADLSGESRAVQLLHAWMRELDGMVLEVARKQEATDVIAANTNALVSAMAPRVERLFVERERDAEALMRVEAHLAEMRVEQHERGKIMGHMYEGIGHLSTLLEQLRDRVTSDISGLKGGLRGMAEQVDRNQDKLSSYQQKVIDFVNRAHPEKPDLADITGVHNVTRIVDAHVTAKLTEHELATTRAALAERNDDKRWLSRQTITWLVAIAGFVMSTAIAILVTLLLKR